MKDRVMSQKLAVDFLTENGSTVSKHKSSKEGDNTEDYRNSNPLSSFYDVQKLKLP